MNTDILASKKPENTATQNQFGEDIINGLTASPKYLPSKYFYDAVGDKLFQDLMNCEDYYPTKCELDIFQNQTAALAEAIVINDEPFDLIELGAGDAMKSSFLLKHLLDNGIKFTYLPIDISRNVIESLDNRLSAQLPGLNFEGLNGEYFDMLKKAAALSNRRKVVMFLGSNIGNMPVGEAESFCFEIREHLSPGDMVLIGFDLKKNPQVILNAYNDREGITRDFNLNLLKRINTELNADFNVDQFQHFPVYDPETGACKSYLISLTEQTVHLKSCNKYVHFHQDECIFMEISQKYTLQQTKDLAITTGFEPIAQLFDQRHWFTDEVWLAK